MCPVAISYNMIDASTDAESRSGWAGFVLLSSVAVFSPWAFGAWEAAWFWAFVALLSSAAILLGVRVLRTKETPEVDESVSSATRSIVRQTALGILPFVGYVVIRALFSEVHMTAERSALLLVTPLLLTGCIALGLSKRQILLLHKVLLINLAVLGLYGLLNHAISGSRLVLWRPGYEMYTQDHRASGPYFCPDHFAGLMELALCLSAGVILSRREPVVQRLLAGGLAFLALVGIALSKSRGAGITLVAVFPLVMVWGFAQWPPVRRWSYRISALSVAGIMLALLVHLNTPYMQRFNAYFGWQTLRGKSRTEAVTAMGNRLSTTSRGRMIGGAIRAWRSRPIFGVGAGMHQNLWPHFAATADGNRETGSWPTQTNDSFHSYEVHSDWVQLMEEYGLLGLALGLLATGSLFRMLRLAFRTGVTDRHRDQWKRRRSQYHPVALGALLCTAAMAFHSLGDFNLQIPATAWTLATIAGLSLGAYRLSPRPRTSRRRRKPTAMFAPSPFRET